ncbi:MAG: hypothetical protein NZ585_02575 [Chloracidobacterium sp.]|nr:hypothetical protein [Chloracidobacterium sp.]
MSHCREYLHIRDGGELNTGQWGKMAIVGVRSPFGKRRTTNTLLRCTGASLSR